MTARSGQAGARDARKRYGAANPDAKQKRRESAKVSYAANREAVNKRKAELRDQRADTVRWYGLAHGRDLFDVGTKIRSVRQW